jgi:isopentenyl-diphosphate delta-isomerase type 1
MSTAIHRVEDEMLDVVDDNDRVIRQEKRGIIHAQRLMHRAVHILIFNDAGQVLLQRRSANKDTFPNRWDSSSSGHVNAGEDYLESALRELGEELGIRDIGAEFLTPLFKINAHPETGREFVWVYKARYNGPFTPLPSEISHVAFFEIAEVARQLAANPGEFAPAFALLWQRTQSAPGIEPRG